jgi:hypothetical protein
VKPARLGHRAIAAAACIDALLLIVSPSVVRAGNHLSATGSCKSFFVAYRNPRSIDRGPMLGSASTRLRFAASWAPSRRFSVSMAYDLAPRVQDHSLFEMHPGGPVRVESRPYRAVDFDTRLYPAGEDSVRSFAVFQNLDRLLLTIRARSADVSIGRQAVAWGSARVINPTDFLAPFTFDELDTEDRAGVDGVRIRVPLGALSELDAGYVAGDDFRSGESTAFLRSRLHLLRTDVSPVVAVFRENLLAGLDLARAVGGAGGWLEVAYVRVDALDSDGSGHDGYTRLSTGLDYSLTESTYGYVEYHFNGAGGTKPEAYFSHLADAAYSEGAVYLLGRHYVAPGITKQITPLVDLTGQAIGNLSDRSTSLSLRIEWNVAENAYAAAGAFLGFGESPGTPGPSENLPYLMRSEFGTYPDVLFSSFRIYF